MGMNREATEVREVSPGYDLMAAKPASNEGYVALGDITRWLSGGTPSRAVESYWKGQIPWISASTLKKVEVAESDQCVTVEAVASGSKMAPIDSTLLLVRGSALHNEIRAGIVRYPVCFNQDVKALIPSKSVYPVYLTYSILGNEKELLKLVSSAGNTAGVLDTKLVQSFRIWLPPLEEQRAIATALSDVDALLEELDRLIAKKRHIKQATMQQLLTGQTRLPGFDGEWETKALALIADIRSGGTPSTSKSEFWNGDLPWCTPTDITALRGKKYLESTERKISHAGLRSSSAEEIPPNSIIMTTRATIGECAINTVPMTTNQGFKNLIPTSVNSEYLYYLMTTQKNRLVQLCAGSTFVEIGKKQLSWFEVLLPKDLEQQREIAAILSGMDAELEALEQRRTKTAILKQAMMQELLTGRTRLISSVDQKSRNDKSQAGKSRANVYFMRSVFAAEIVDQLHEEPTFGHVKLEKVLYLAEHLCSVDTGSIYRRKSAGPYDNRALRSIDSQLRKQKWFEARKEGRRYFYEPLQKRGGHQTYFNRYFSSVRGIFDRIIETLRGMDTERCEIVATLYAAWNDLLRENGDVSDQAIVHEVLNNWHESKKRISEDRWLRALGWMRDKGITPKRA